MRRYIVERDLPGIGQSDADWLRAAAMRSNRASADLAPGIQWIESYVVAERAFCVYLATDAEVIRRHSLATGIPCTRIHEIKATMDPSTAD